MAMSDQRIQYTMQMVGANHPSLADTLNCLVKGVNNFRLVLSGGNLTLQAVNGNLVDINEVIYACTAMPTLAATGLTPGTLYYIYLYNNSGNEALEASATGYAVDSKGRAYKSGDLTRRLMGMARVVAGPAWADSPTQRFVRSYDNRQPCGGENYLAANTSTASTTPVEIQSAIRIEFLMWASEIADVVISGTAWNDTAGSSCCSAVGFDGATEVDGVQIGTSSAASSGFCLAPAAKRSGLAEGYHYVTLVGYAGGHTAWWEGSVSAPERVTIWLAIVGAR